MKSLKTLFMTLFAFMATLALSATFLSCQSVIETDKFADPFPIEKSSEIPDMEFIGFKTGTSEASWKAMTQYSSIKNLGATLQLGGIAIDQSFAYFGIYSLQELEVYRSSKRYVTFVEIVTHQLNVYQDINEGRRLTGAMLTGLVVTAPIGIPLLFTGYKTKYTLKGEYDFYVYDTQTHKITYKDRLALSESDVYKGLWDESGKVGEYYATLVSNAILEKYTGIKQYLKSIE